MDEMSNGYKKGLEEKGRERVKGEIRERKNKRKGVTQGGCSKSREQNKKH